MRHFRSLGNDDSLRTTNALPAAATGDVSASMLFPAFFEDLNRINFKKEQNVHSSQLPSWNES